MSSSKDASSDTLYLAFGRTPSSMLVSVAFVGSNSDSNLVSFSKDRESSPLDSASYFGPFALYLWLKLSSYKGSSTVLSLWCLKRRRAGFDSKVLIITCKSMVLSTSLLISRPSSKRSLMATCLLRCLSLGQQSFLNQRAWQKGVFFFVDALPRLSLRVSMSLVLRLSPLFNLS